MKKNSEKNADALRLRRKIDEHKQAEELLRENRKFLADLVEYSETIIFVKDMEGRYELVNRKFEEITGVPRESIIGRTDADCFPAHIAERFREADLRVIESGQAIEMEDFVDDPNNKYLLTIKFPLYADDGNVKGVCGISTDITERKQMEAVLRENEVRYRSIFENAFDAILLTSPDGAILDANSSACRMFGRTVEEIKQIGRGGLVDITDPRVRAALEERARFGKAYAEFNMLRADGIKFPTEVTSTLFVDALGAQKSSMIIRDITERKQTEDSLRRRTDEMTALQATILDISTPHSLPDLLNLIVERAANLLGASSGGLYLTEQELHKVRCVVSYKTKSDFTGTLLDFGDGAAGIVAETGQPLIIDDYSKWTGRARVYEQGHPFQAVMSAPMLWQGKVSGVIHLLRDDDSKKFTQEELNLLILFANHAAVAVENARLFSLLDKELTERKRTEEKLQEANKRLEEQLEEIKILQDYLREQAIRDSLTGLYNRRYLDETMERELARARRENYSVSVIMIDIDHFKNFNDTYGHQAGDKVLTALSGLLRSGVRQGDIACRYGGEEFLVIMPGVDEVDAKRRAEAIRSSFNGLRVNYGEAELSVSISIGVAFYPQHGNDMNEIVKAADAALYEAKQSGRNLVHIFRSA